MERRKFEESFKDAFEGAEVSPPEGVWTNIELDLEKADGSKIRRRLLFYKMLAAASVAFAMCVAGIGYYVTSERSGKFNGVLTEKSSDPSDKDNNNLTPEVIGDGDKSSGLSGPGLPESSNSQNSTSVVRSREDNSNVLKDNAKVMIFSLKDLPTQRCQTPKVEPPLGQQMVLQLMHWD